MKISRNFATGATIATFFVVGISGLLMFLHWDSFAEEGITNLHEYLGIAMVLACILHIFVNIKAFKKYFEGKTFYGIIAVFLLSAIFVFIPQEPKSKDMFLDKIMSQNISEIKQLLKIDEASFNTFLKENQLEISQDMSLNELIEKSGMQRSKFFEVLSK